jgi:alkylhydroperoxidase/carboxymuconolactone decarboxylase family protein YurZ
VAYNKAKEEYRWNQWKAEEEKILREQGVDEETIQKLREYDWNDFNAERRFREHQTSLLDCMELLLEEKESGESQPESVEALLDTVENEEWNNEDIDLKTRSIITVVALMAQGITDSSLKFHLQNAKDHGVTQKEIAAIITHVAFYAGWPKGWAVFNLAKEVWNEDETEE